MGISKIILFLAVCVAFWGALLPQQSFAKASPFRADQNQPIEIEADHALEWIREKNIYVVKGNATAKQGGMEIKGDTLTAYYSENPEGGTQISKIIAEGQVEIISALNKALGDRAVYNLETGKAILTGQYVELITPTEVIQAQESLEFFSLENKMVARGKVNLQRGKDYLEADLVKAQFVEDISGALALKRLVAQQNVIIRTAKEIVYGDYGVYDTQAQKAEVSGKVRIQQGENWLEGKRAEVDLKTGASQLFAGEEQGMPGRVRGVFYPNSQKNPPPK